MTWFLAYNQTSDTVQISVGGRIVPPREFTYADDAVLLVADLLSVGTLRNVMITFDPDGSPSGIDPEAYAAAREVVRRNNPYVAELDDEPPAYEFDPKGRVGPRGATGPQGPIGETGAAGPVGPQGERGFDGPEGPQGPQGPKGDDGFDGADGANGPPGPTGPTGATGPAGPQGDDGADGASDAIDVKMLHGAVGDGTTNDTAAVQSALNAAAAAGGGIVSFPKGTYMVDSGLTVPTNTTLRGAGGNTSIVKVRTGSTVAWLFNASSKTNVRFIDLGMDGSGVLAVKSGVYASTSGTEKNISVDRCHIKNFGPGIADNQHGGVYVWTSQNVRVKDCHFTDCGRAINARRANGFVNIEGNHITATADNLMATGIFVGDSSGVATGKVTIANNFVDRANFDPAANTSEGHNISIYRTSGAKITGNHVERGGRGILVSFQAWGAIVDGNTAAFNDDAGIRIEPEISTTDTTVGAADALRGCVVSNNIAHSNGGAHGGIGITMSYAAGSIVSGNTCYRNSEDGILVDSDRVIVIGNTCYNNWYEGLYPWPAPPAGQGSKAGIRFYAGLNIMVVGNTCFDNQTTKTQSYGLSVRLASQKPILIGNYFEGNAVSEIDNPNFCTMGVSSAWDKQHLVLGTHHLWADATGRLRIKSGIPTGPTDGEEIITTTTVPDASYDSTWNGDLLALGAFNLWFDDAGALRYKNGAPTAADDGFEVADTIDLDNLPDPVVIPAQPTPPDPSQYSLWVDTSKTVKNTVRSYRDDIVMSAAGDLYCTVGQPPLAKSESVFVNGVYKHVGEYTQDGTDNRRFTLLNLPSAAKVAIGYEYDADLVATPASSDQATIIVEDFFTRANSTSSMGTTPQGLAWTNNGGNVYGINGNEAYRTADSSNVWGATIQASQADVDVSAKFVVLDGTMQLIVRYDGANGYFVGNGAFSRRASGVNTTLATWPAISAGDTLRVTVVGSTFKVFKQTASTGPFILLATVSDTTSVGTQHGFRYTDGNGITHPGRWDDFRIKRAF